jgi:hypothetical protein
VQPSLAFCPSSLEPQASSFVGTSAAGYTARASLAASGSPVSGVASRGSVGFARASTVSLHTREACLTVDLGVGLD